MLVFFLDGLGEGVVVVVMRLGAMRVAVEVEPSWLSLGVGVSEGGSARLWACVQGEGWLGVRGECS